MHLNELLNIHFFAYDNCNIYFFKNLHVGKICFIWGKIGKKGAAYQYTTPFNTAIYFIFT